MKERQEVKIIETVHSGETMKLYISPLQDIGFFSVYRRGRGWVRVSEPIKLGV